MVCPGFVTDCLETLEEINIEVRDTFVQAGGGEYHYIPCLNDRPDWAEALADLVMTLVAAAVTAVSGLAVGWRVHTGPGPALLALALCLLFAYAAAWGGAVVGLLARGAESAQAVGLLVIMPLSVTSNAFISTDHLTPWLRDAADWNPVSVLAAACRRLLGNPDPAAAIRIWPMQHPVLASALWSAGLIAALAPLAIVLYVRRAQR